MEVTSFYGMIDGIQMSMMQQAQNKEWHWRLARSEGVVDIQSNPSQIHIKERDRALGL